MSNHDLTIANGPGINVRQDIEAALQALGTNFFGPAVPLITYPCQIWADSAAGVLRIRNTPNTAWITLGPLDTASFGMLPLTGGTITGNLTVNGTTNVAALNSGSHVVTGTLNVSGGATFQSTVLTNSAYVIDSAAGTSRGLFGRTAGVARWTLIVANPTAESGSNAGSDFQINRYNDGGAFLDTPMSIIRATGAVTFSNPVTVLGSVSLNVAAGQFAVYYATVAGARSYWFGCGADGSFNIADASAGTNRLAITTAGNVTILQNLTVNGAASNFVGNLTVGTSLQVSAGNGVQRAVQWQTNGSLRWHLMCDQTAEGGGNAGSNYSLFAFANDGSTAIGSVYSVVRATRVVTFAVAIVNPSDGRLKSDVEPVGNALDLVEALEGVYYRKIAEPERRQVGLIAQDVRAIFPEVVFETADQTDDGEAILGIEYGKLVPVLINAIKELSAKVATLEGVTR